MEINSIHNARKPKNATPIAAAGVSAISTYNMVFSMLSDDRMWGVAVTV
jgi:hypothetical protein